jgi:hypothetical protein
MEITILEGFEEVRTVLWTVRLCGIYLVMVAVLLWCDLCSLRQHAVMMSDLNPSKSPSCRTRLTYEVWQLLETRSSEQSLQCS